MAYRDRDDDRRGGRSEFKYHERSADTVQRRATQQGGAFDAYIDSKFPTFRVKEADHSVRILPVTWTDFEKWGDSWGIDIYVHGNVGPDNNTYLCLQKMLGKRCPICDARRELEADGDEQAADKIRLSRRVLAWVLDRNATKLGPQVWSLPWTLDKDINKRCKDKRTGEVLQIDHPKRGFDVNFTREGAGLRTKYTGVELDRDPTPIYTDPDKQERILEFLQENPLPSVIKFYEADYIEKIYAGAGKKKDEDDEDDDRDRGRGRGRRDDDDDDRRKRRDDDDDRGRDKDRDDDRDRKRRDDDDDDRGRGRRDRDDDDRDDDRDRKRDRDDDDRGRRRDRDDDDRDRDRKRDDDRGRGRDRDDDDRDRDRKRDRDDDDRDDDRGRGRRDRDDDDRDRKRRDDDDKDEDRKGGGIERRKRGDDDGKKPSSAKDAVKDLDKKRRKRDDD